MGKASLKSKVNKTQSNIDTCKWVIHEMTCDDMYEKISK